MSPVHPQVIFAVVYAAFLLGISYALRWEAKRYARTIQGEPSWAHGLAARFRVGLAALVLILAAFILASAGWRFHHSAEIGLLSLGGAVVFFEGWKLWRSRASTPTLCL